jgi:serine/threonine-protein kinase
MAAASDPPRALPPGTVLAHYRLGEVLGSGAMGTVYRAHDLGLERGVAVKVLRPEVADEPRTVERFFREARAAARVSHPNVAHVYYVGSADLPGLGEQRFFALEHVPGADLDAEVRARGPLSLERAVDLLVQAARGLGAAHAAGLVHRDVKPSNLIVRPDGTLKVTDFGLSRSIHGETEASGGGNVTGTPLFMSPEQVRGETVDRRVDVYTLGLTAWYLLCGHPPFPGPSLGKVLSDQLNAPLPSVLATRPDLPAAVDEVLARLCAKDPARRPDDMEQVLQLLETLRPRRVLHAPLAARASAYALDWMIVALVLAGIQWVLGAALGIQVTKDDRWPGIAFCVLWAIVSLGMELWKQASPGKLLLHLAVVRREGLRPDPRALVVRFVARSPEALLGGIPIFPWWTFAWTEGAMGVALVAGLVCWLATQGRTLSDVVSRTTVAYRHPDPIEPAA